MMIVKFRRVRRPVNRTSTLNHHLVKTLAHSLLYTYHPDIMSNFYPVEGFSVSSLDSGVLVVVSYKGSASQGV
jgi:hypothetical protein